MDDQIHYSVRFPPCRMEREAYLRWASDKSKERWLEQARYLFCLFLLLFSNFRFVSGKNDGGSIVKLSDYQALMALKSGLVDFRGVLKSWNDSGFGACSGRWAGIQCLNGLVITIQLPWKGLGGRISERIGQFHALRRLSLHDNALVGPIPRSLGLLQNLRGVYLFNNRLSGTIPLGIGYCPVLQTLDLSNNRLTGSIPPILSNCTRLYRLNLSYNNLSGSVPDSWNGNFSSLSSLDLSSNNIDGSFPESLTKISSLVIINLKNNNLDSQIPYSIERLHKLSVLILRNNRFKGQIPDTIGNITMLTFLDLSKNYLTGQIPISLANLPNLSSFDVSYNNLSGAVASVLAKRFNSSSFIGNMQLCGYSGSTPCPSPQPDNLSSPSKGSAMNPGGRMGTKDTILISVGAILLVLLLLCCVFMCCLIIRKAASKGKNSNTRGLASRSKIEVESGGEAGGKLVHFEGHFVFTADDLLSATAEIMGKSSYGTTYKATLGDNNQVAVKRLREKITKANKEFEIELAKLGKIRHLNILALRAYYVGPKGEKLLVYDCMPNGSLASFLHARGPEKIVSWKLRMNIAIGITEGLHHLHTEENIVHGNLTSSIVLLDEKNKPKIADVGLSHLVINAAKIDIIATAGTLGYRAPELSKLKNANTKTDMYSLGVIILELLTGKSPSEATDGLELPQWVASIVKEEWTNEVFDIELMKDVSNIGDDLLNTLKLALHCVDPLAAARPEALQVLQKLEEIQAGSTVASPAASVDQQKSE
ncbi:LOW QUALITY PROTEIN: probably inactive leucine-rich repeat receptor-like protein kinase IMK2 [Primulina tabacum]|uniref:LOW QUALITY PROTEIN: probably inactive leucine-rich repeat receptor-like protein kinase IMK2 n=1 Tax=Primulina tabacum TaxID=48773 RepID=UPI003F5A82A0